MNKNKKTHKVDSNMKLAFFLNFSFTIIEIIGGLLTNSISILSDAIHDLGDSISIGISLVLEKISKREPDKVYTYGYLRFSTLGALINLIVLSIGTVLIMINCIPRLFHPEVVNYNGMLILAIIGLVINGIGAFRTSKTKSLSEKVISLHLLEDVLGWAMVLVVSLLIKFFNVYFLDSVLSFGISIFIVINIIKNMKKVLSIILEKTPLDIDLDQLKTELLEECSIQDMHHIHVWSMDGSANYLTAHIVVEKTITKKEMLDLKEKIREELLHFEIGHSTLEFETEEEHCEEQQCNVQMKVETHAHVH